MIGFMCFCVSGVLCFSGLFFRWCFRLVILVLVVICGRLRWFFVMWIVWIFFGRLFMMIWLVCMIFLWELWYFICLLVMYSVLFLIWIFGFVRLVLYFNNVNWLVIIECCRMVFCGCGWYCGCELLWYVGCKLLKLVCSVMLNIKVLLCL